jgi:hypothetical protein
MVDILQARTPDHIGDARRLFQEYAEWLDRDYAISLDFQGIADELATLPGKYAPLKGEFLIAYHECETIACIAHSRLRFARSSHYTCGRPRVD